MYWVVTIAWRVCLLFVGRGHESKVSRILTHGYASLLHTGWEEGNINSTHNWNMHYCLLVPHTNNRSFLQIWCADSNPTWTGIAGSTFIKRLATLGSSCNLLTLSNGTFLMKNELCSNIHVGRFTARKWVWLWSVSLPSQLILTCILLACVYMYTCIAIYSSIALPV